MIKRGEPDSIPAERTRSELAAPTGQAHVYFAFNAAELSDAAKTALRPVIRALERDQALRLQLDGYTDSVGEPVYNLELSQRRVAAVRSYLVEQRIALPRMQSIGRGVLSDRAVAEKDKRRVTVTLQTRPR